MTIDTPVHQIHNQSAETISGKNSGNIPGKNANCYPDLLLSAEDAQTMALQLKALAHPVRLQILQQLGNWNRGCCNDFCACIPLAQSTISQHLKILCKAGIINYQTAGNSSQYTLNPDALESAIAMLSRVNQFADGVNNLKPNSKSSQ